MMEPLSCPCSPIISSVRPFEILSKFYDQYSSDDILPEGYLMLLSISCDMSKDFFKETFFEMNKFRKNEPINFCKFYDNEGATQLLLRSDHFISPTV